MTVLLKVVGGPRRGLEHRSVERAAITIGRSKANDFHVLEDTLSRMHAIVGHDEDGWYVEDRESSHGVWVNDERVSRARLHDGALFRLGASTVVRFSLTDEDELFATGEIEVAPRCRACGERIDVADLFRGGGGKPFHLACRNLNHLAGEELGEFRIVEPVPSLGEGFMFRAHQPALSRPVTLAVFDPPLIARPGYRDAVLDAFARTQPAAVIPHVLQILDFGEARGLCYVVMERFAGRRLSRILEERRFVKIREAAQVAVRTLDAVHYVQEQGGFRAWVSPSRVLVSEEHDVKLFLFEDPGRTSQEPDAADAAYVAPEPVDGADRSATESALVYSVASLLYHMLAGIPPFEGATPEEVARRARLGRPPALRRINLKVSPALATAVESGIARDPGERPATLLALRNQIARAAGVR